MIDKSVPDEHRRYVKAKSRVLHEFVVRDPVPQIVPKCVERAEEFPGECSLESLSVRVRIRHRQKVFALPGHQVIADDSGKREPPAGGVAFLEGRLEGAVPFDIPEAGRDRRPCLI